MMFPRSILVSLSIALIVIKQRLIMVNMKRTSDGHHLLSRRKRRIRKSEEEKRKEKKEEERTLVKIDKLEAENKKLTQDVKNIAEENAKLRGDLIITSIKAKLKKTIKEKDEAAKDVNVEARKINKNVISTISKNSNVALEKEELSDNLRELAEIELQCAVCTEVFLDACTLNCGHTFCFYCIYKWKKENSNCPMCRSDIKYIVTLNNLDQFVDKMYGKFVSESRRAERASLRKMRLLMMDEERRRERETKQQIQLQRQEPTGSNFQSRGIAFIQEQRVLLRPRQVSELNSTPPSWM